MSLLKSFPYASKLELIDTLWNVNTYFMIKSWALSCELIDTLWNVNNK